MINVNAENKNIKVNKLNDKFMNTWFMKTLSRDDLVGYIFASLVSVGGIWLMLYIYKM